MTQEEMLIEIGRLREVNRWLMDALAPFADVSVEDYGIGDKMLSGVRDGYRIEGGATVDDLLHLARVYQMAKGSEVSE